MAKGLIRKLAAVALIALANAGDAQTRDRCDPDRFVDNRDGTVTDRASGLMWKVCSEAVWPYTWSPLEGCGTEGFQEPSAFVFPGAKQVPHAVNAGAQGQDFGYFDWRLPSIGEMRSLSNRNCPDPGLPDAIFPPEPDGFHWTDTVAGELTGSRWTVNLETGAVRATGAGVGALATGAAVLCAGWCGTRTDRAPRGFGPQ